MRIIARAVNGAFRSRWLRSLARRYGYHVRGKLDFQGTIRNQLRHKKVLSCTYDDLSVNNPYNQMLQNHDTVLIIDTKYYGKMMQRNAGGREKFHSANMYQIYCYVKNYDVEQNKTVSGMLLYARTDEDIVPNGSIMMDGNRIGVRTLDLNREFSEIAAQLDAIVEEYFY